MAARPAAAGGDVVSLQDVLRGRTDGAQRTKSSSNMIRVFISSTFTGHCLTSSYTDEIQDYFICLCAAGVC